MGDVPTSAILDAQRRYVVYVGARCIWWGDIRATTIRTYVRLIEGEEVG